MLGSGGRHIRPRASGRKVVASCREVLRAVRSGHYHRRTLSRCASYKLRPLHRAADGLHGTGGPREVLGATSTYKTVPVAGNL